MYKSPHIGYQNVVSFTCSDAALPVIIELLEILHDLGQAGCSRTINVGSVDQLNWDGDGAMRLENIVINGLNKQQWQDERNRLAAIRAEFSSMVTDVEDKLHGKSETDEQSDK